MVMVPLREYHRVQDMKISKLKQGIRRGPITAAKYMAAQVRRLAPRNTGRLLASVRRNRNHVRVGGTNPINGFPYVHWINQTEGYKVLTAGKYTDWQGIPRVSIKGNWIRVRGGLMVYGAAPSNWNWTGTPRFATIARNSARQFFRNTMLTETRKAITLSG